MTFKSWSTLFSGASKRSKIEAFSTICKHTISLPQHIHIFGLPIFIFLCLNLNLLLV